MASIYDLVYDYIEWFFPEERLTKEQKKTIHQEIKTLLNDGWCADELMDTFKQYTGRKTLHAKKLVRGKKPKKKNLLTVGTFYYHNDLRLTSSPPKRVVDYDSGEITIINEPYFLEMKASYSIDDLIQYYIKQMGAGRKKDHARYVGSFQWLLKHYDIETILFMIDAASNDIQAEDLPPLSSPLDIQDYDEIAKDMRIRKKTETITAGGNHIVRKKRSRSNRNRC